MKYPKPVANAIKAFNKTRRINKARLLKADNAYTAAAAKLATAEEALRKIKTESENATSAGVREIIRTSVDAGLNPGEILKNHV